VIASLFVIKSGVIEELLDEIILELIHAMET